MSSENKNEIQIHSHHVMPQLEKRTYIPQLERMASRPRRNPILHWVAFVLSLVSLGLAIRFVGAAGPVPYPWLFLDIALSVFFAFEFFTRSGFRWNPGGYMLSRVFDFVAIVPALVLVHYNVVLVVVWFWIILICRVIRAADRILGDGFVQRNFLALLEGFEEEITDRVMIRIINRIQTDLERGKFGNVIGQALERHKGSMLERIHEEHPQRGLGVGLARLTGLEAAVERAEERTYDAVVEVLESPEVDHVIHDAVESSFAVIQTEIGQKSWKKHLGIHYKYTGE